MPECVIDGRPTDTALCRGCLDVLLSELRSVDWLTAQLTITLTRQARVGERNGPRSADRPLPFHHGASVDLESLQDGLLTWAKSVADRRGASCDTLADPPDLAKWLLLYPSELASHPEAAELHGDICSLTKAARRTIDRNPDLRYLGPCDECTEDLYVRDFGGRLPAEVSCKASVTDETGETKPCGTTYKMEERRLWLLEQAYNRLLTAAEMSRALPALLGKPISANLIAKWAGRHRITRYPAHPQDPHRRPRYLVEEVIKMARKHVEARVSA